jgi:hypothetical protein
LLLHYKTWNGAKLVNSNEFDAIWSLLRYVVDGEERQPPEETTLPGLVWILAVYDLNEER